MRRRSAGLAGYGDRKGGLALDIDACERAGAELGSERGGGARRQKRKAADQSLQDVEKLHLLARHSRVAEEAELPVKILHGERVGIVKRQASQLRRDREGHLDEVVEIGFTADVAQPAHIMRLQRAQRAT